MLTVERLDNPATPITLGEAKVHIRVLHDDEDDSIAGMLEAATRELEEHASLALVTQGIRATFDPPPLSSSIPLPVGPVLTGAEVAVTVDGEPFTAFALIPGKRPSIRLDDDELCFGELVVTYQAGFGATRAAIPEDIVVAILDQVAALYDTRGTVEPRHLGLGGMSPHFARIAARYRRVAI